MVTLFFSYSHRDEELRNELEIHLSALKRQGLIDTWHDRRIGAGDIIDHVISENLESADIILLLVSPYFIASDYCYDVELTRSLERHHSGEARVIPVILHPCDWRPLPFGTLLAVPKDGKPISKFPNPHDAFLEVSTAIRKCAEELKKIVESPSESSGSKSPIIFRPDVVRSSNLRVKKLFNDIERDRFQTEAFEYIANFFENSLGELAKRNAHIETEFRRIDANQFTGAIYSSGSEVSRCTIALGNKTGHIGGITYSLGRGSGTGFNESLSIGNDGYTLFLRPLGMFSFGAERDKKLSREGAAEYFWERLIQPLQH